jgi:hypothetical protein
MDLLCSIKRSTTPDKVSDAGQLIQLLDKVSDAGQLIQLLDKVSDAGKLVQLLDKVGDTGQLIQLLDKVGDVGQLIQLLDKVGDVGQLIQLLDKVGDVGQLIQLLDKISDNRKLIQLLDRLTPDEILSLFRRIDGLLSNPKSIWGLSADELAKLFTDAGYKAVVEASSKGSKKSLQIRIERHPIIGNIQVHPGGGRHGGAYYKISTSNQGIIKIVDRTTYVPTPGEKAKIIYIN